ncbi:serine hydrolase domain-containing protein [Hoeflea poritis]|uniref:Serine hydrolase n=1 Tax=Hoeflea poritis TaxID=2993659 RepID=A0ABT4VHR0_9HYPH|nr:serine hydrolase [Hoeflea poritis]MDA4844246.1 serine hydrolase [Hoeflea poritis]
MPEKTDSDPNSRPFVRWMLIPAPLAVVAIALLVYMMAPYLPRLIYEGYPAQHWPASGSYATVRGTAEPKPHWIAASKALNARAQDLFEQNGGTALLVWQGGLLQAEHYAPGFDTKTQFNSFSMVKSLVGALVLRAHAEGRIAELSDPIGNYLPNIGNARFRSVPVEQFLTMRSGVVFDRNGSKALSSNEPKHVDSRSLNPFGPNARLHMQGLDALATSLRTDASRAGQYDYQNVNTAVLGRLLSAIYDRPLEDILADQIWRPSGAANAHWRLAGEGKPVSAYCCLFATARDWIRVAIFLSHNGKPNEPFLPPDLWQQYFGHAVTQAQRRLGHYGTQIFHNVLDRQGEPLQGPFTYMLGRGGQTTYMMPQHDLVVVRFGERIPLLHSTLYAAWDSVSTGMSQSSSQRSASSSE